jgi:predicted acylesterase/phospholipase RssA
MTIKHLVISGGGPTLIQMLSAIQELERNNYLDRKEIKSIYGTSAGAILGVLFSLNMDWESINDYVIKRPWHELFSIKVQNILDAYTKKGIYDNTIIEKCFKPVLDAKDISLHITLDEFQQHSNIELHFFTFEVNQFQMEDVSYKTHPKLSLLTAIQMTCALPVMVSPVFLEDKCYVDGGVVSNYPLKYCIEAHNEPDEILGFKNKYDNYKRNHIHSGSTLLDFVMGFLFKLINSLSTQNVEPSIKNEIEFNTSLLSIEILKNALKNIETRKELFENGIQTANTYLSLKE